MVITPAVDRLSRDTTDLLVIAREMQRAGAGIRSLAEPYLDTTSDFAEIVLAILGVAAKLERRCPQLQCQPEHHFETARAANGRPYAMQAIMDEWKAGGAVKDELGRTVRLDKTARGSGDTIIDSLHVESLEQPELRKKSFFGSASG